MRFKIRLYAKKYPKLFFNFLTYDFGTLDDL